MRAVRGRRKKISEAIRAAVLMLSVGSSLLLTGCWCWASKPAYGFDFRPDFATLSTRSGEGDTWQKLFPLTSTHRFYLESDVVFLPELLGTWNDEENGIGVIFEARGKRGYRITFTGKDGKMGIKGRLVRLGGELFLQLRWRTGCDMGTTIHARRIGRIRIDGGVLRMAAPRHRLKKYTYWSGFWIGTPASDTVAEGTSKKKLRTYLINNVDKYFSTEKETILRRVSPPLAKEPYKSEPDSAGGNQNEG